MEAFIFFMFLNGLFGDISQNCTLSSPIMPRNLGIIIRGICVCGGDPSDEVLEITRKKFKFKCMHADATFAPLDNK
jgi:hypothetical protein